jgi:hypothetical protein
MRLVEQRAGTAEGAVRRESGDDQEDKCNRHNSSRYQGDRSPRALGVVSDTTSVPMLCSVTVLQPVVHPVAVRVGAALPAVSVRGQLRA